MGWDLSRQTHSLEIGTLKNLNSVIQFANLGAHGCFGPLSAAPSSAGKIRSSERLFESRGGLRFVQVARMSFASAYFGEQRRNQAEARVHFLLVTYSLGKQRKVTRLQAK